MKKFLLLCLVLVGYVSTASAVTIYVQNTRAWDAIYLYEWNGESDVAVAWPGTQQCVREIIDGNWYFKITISREKFLLTNNSGTQTADHEADGFIENAYYWIGENNKDKLTKMDAPTATHLYNISAKADASCPIYNIYTFQSKEGVTTDLSGGWPGAYVIPNSDGEYNLTIGSNSVNGEIKVIFDQGDSKQTGDLWAVEGDNSYYIASMTSNKNGEGVKTNSKGCHLRQL